MNVWKVLGLAGVAGVGATGVIIARNERRRAQLNPDEVRLRLRQRYAELESPGLPPVLDSAVPPAREARHRMLRWPWWTGRQS